MLSTYRPFSKSFACLFVTVLGVCAAGCGNSKPAGGTRGTGGAGGAGGSGVPAQKLVILHTNDLHSHFMGHAPERDYTPLTPGDDLTMGGVARLASAITTARAGAAASATPVLLLDAGDYMMGTLFELLALSQAPELKFMQMMAYDATTIGNHELDWTPRGFAGILQTAVAADVTVPILASNMVFSDVSPGDDDLKNLFDAGVIRSKLVKTIGADGTQRGLKVGFFGLLGEDAALVTPQAAPLTFEAIAGAATRMVAELRGQDNVDLVIALSHSGISSNGEGEDAALARAVPGIDVIISGHTHDTLMQPVTVGKTVIVTAGSYGSHLGELRLSVIPPVAAGQNGTVVVDGYTLKSIDDSVPGDGPVQEQVDALIGLVDASLASSNLSYAKVVGRTASDLVLTPYDESNLGNLVTDAYRTIGARLQPTDPPVVAVEGNGQLRANILAGTTGEIWLADLFRVTPIGIGPNQVPGYPLVTFYLNAQDIRSGLELGGAPELVPDQYFLQLSGLKVQYDMSQMPFRRVSSLTLVTGTTEQPLDINNTTQCYKVIATSYVAGLLGVVESFTGGLLSVRAKDRDCVTPVNATTRFVDANPATPAIDELKHWQATLSYVQGFPPEDGAPIVPAAYATTQGRITRR